MASEQPKTKRALERLFAARITDTATVPFAVTDQYTGAVIGTTSLYDYLPEQSRVEIGMTFFHRDYWGGGTNTASKLHLLRFAFEELLVHRVTLRCDVRNTRSASAILKLGATPEGVLRGYRRGPDGSRVDTSVYSILENEWPQVQSGLLQRLDPVLHAPDYAQPACAASPCLAGASFN